MAADATLVGTHDTPCHDTLVPDPNRGAVMMTGEDQIAIENVGASYFLSHPEFQRGVDDVRRGRPPSFDRAGQNRRDRIDSQWAYERGRQFPRCAHGQNSSGVDAQNCAQNCARGSLH